MAEVTPRSNEVIDKINEFNKAHGQEEIPYEITAPEGEFSGEQKLAKQKEIDDAAAETERLRIEAEEKEKGDTLKDKPADTPTKIELTKEQKEAIAMELFGVTDLKDLVKKSDIKTEPTADEIEAAKQAREDERVAFKLKKVGTKQFEQFIMDIKDPQSLVFAQYKQEQKALDSTLTDTEIESEFNSKYGLDAEEGSRLYTRGQKEIGILAEKIVKDKHSKIYELDSEFDSFEKEQLTQKQLSEKLISEAPAYKQAVEEIYTSLKKIPISLGKGEDYEVEMPDDIIDAFKKRELENEFAASQIKGGYTKENKTTAAKLALIYENLPMVIKSVADKINAKRQAGAKGIPPVDGVVVKEVKKLTTEQQKNLEEFEKTHGKTMAN